MKELYSRLYVGNDKDYEKVKDNPDWYIVRACKEGPGSHREQLGYTTMGAPKGPNYLHIEKGRVLALNLIDTDDPNFIPDPIISKALSFISHHLGLGHKVLVACNHGQSRSPSLIFLWLYMNGKLPVENHKALRMFRQIYPDYDPADGIILYVKRRMRELKSQR